MKKYFAIVLAMLLLLSITSCGKDTSEGNTSTADTKAESVSVTESANKDTSDKNTSMTDEKSNTSTTSKSENAAVNVNITETPAAALQKTLTEYTDPNGCFTATIPEDWTVSTAGYGMLYWIRMYDPLQPDLQVFSLIAADCTLLMDQSSKDYEESMRGYSLYTAFADMIVVEQVEDFYEQFNEYCDFMATYESTYAGFEYPNIANFETLEKNSYNSLVSQYSTLPVLDDSILHGVYDDMYTGQKGEGMFSGTLVRAMETNGIGLNTMYNINAISAPYGEFSEYESLLNQILCSIKYTDSFTSSVLESNAQKAEESNYLSQVLQETADIFAQGWENRQKSYDIISQKQSDATLGYERVYDTETNKVYKAYNGYSDTLDSDSRYQPITEDMYSTPISGYIEK